MRPGPTSYSAGDPNFWIGTDVLLWWTKNQPLPVPLLTTGPASQGANAGALGSPGTASLDGPLHNDLEGGFRLSLGGWFTPSHAFGMDGSIFFMGQQNSGFSAYDRSGTGAFVINEPVAGAPFVTQVSAPGVDTGGATVNAYTRFWGADTNLLLNLYRSNGLTVNLLGGFRYLQLQETINITANSEMLTATNYTDNVGNVLVSAPAGSGVTVFDQFGTRNDFYGGQIGTQIEYILDRWSFGGVGTIAIGTTHETVFVNGFTNVYPTNAAPVSLLGGNYATLQTGRYSMDHFAVAPSVQLNLGYQFTPCIRGQIGYDFMYLSSVVRPGTQIDNTYDGVVHPIVPMSNSSFWAQGINISVRFSY